MRFAVRSGPLHIHVCSGEEGGEGYTQFVKRVEERVCVGETAFQFCSRQAVMHLAHASLQLQPVWLCIVNLQSARCNR